MSQFAVEPFLDSPTVTIRDVRCNGSCRHLGPEEAVAEANQVLFFNAREEYRVRRDATHRDPPSRWDAELGSCRPPPDAEDG